MKYDAFISYRHLPKDMYVAKRVHKALETTKIPRKIQKEIGRKKINRVFRDQEELPIGSDLGSNIEAALREAGFLIVICSPQTKDSYWVMKEIDTFISMHGRENVLAVLVDGEPEDSFPPQLLTDEAGNPVEPLAADVRGKNKAETKRKLKTETLRLAASILHVDYDDLKQRHRERRFHKILGITIAIATVIIALAVAFALYNAYNLKKINAEYQEKLANESRVLAEKSSDALEEGNRRVATLLALEGLPTEEGERPVVPESIYALAQALDCYDIGVELRYDKILQHNLQVDDFNEKLDGTRVISYDTSNFVYLWDLDTGEKLFELMPEYEYQGSGYVYDIKVKAVGFSEKAAVVVDNDSVTGYDDQGNVLYKYESDRISDGEIYEACNKAVFVDGETLVVIDTNTGDVLKKYDDHLEIGFGYNFNIDNTGKYLAVSRYVNSGEQNYVTVYDMDTDEYSDCALAVDTVLDLKITADKQVAIATMAYDDIMSTAKHPMYYQKFDIATGTEAWRQEVINEGGAFDTSYTHISSVITEIDGEECGRIIINTSKTVYLMDLYTGEIVNTITTDTAIQRIAFNTTGTYIFVGTNNGKVTLYTTKPGITLSNGENTVMDGNLINFLLSGGRLVAMGYRNSNLVTMKYSTDETMLYEVECSDDISSIPAISPDGSSYIAAVRLNDEDYSFEFDVVDAKTGKLTNSFVVPQADYKLARYIDDDTIIVPGSRGDVCTYNISKDKLETHHLLKDVYGATTSYSADGKYMLYSEGADHIVISLPECDVVYETQNRDASIGMYSWGTISNDGKTIYFISSRDRDALCKYDIEKDEVEVLNAGTQVSAFGLSHDNTKLAVACTDGVLKVYDTETMTSMVELPFYAKTYSGLIQFSDNDRQLYLQGADLYFEIYDLNRKAFVFKLPYQTNEFDYCKYDETNNRLVLSNFIGMAIIDLDTMGELGWIKHGRAYIPQNSNIICQYNECLYGFKFKELDELLEMAKEQYGDDELTDIEKLDYNIE